MCAFESVCVLLCVGAVERFVERYACFVCGLQCDYVLWFTVMLDDVFVSFDNLV